MKPEYKNKIKHITAEEAYKKSIFNKDAALLAVLASVYAEINETCESSMTSLVWKAMDHPRLNFYGCADDVIKMLKEDGYDASYYRASYFPTPDSVDSDGIFINWGRTESETN